MNYDKSFTTKKGIKIQSEQLKGWKMVLKKKVYLALVEYAIKDNHKSKTGYDICRGTNLDNFIANYNLRD